MFPKPKKEIFKGTSDMGTKVIFPKSELVDENGNLRDVSNFFFRGKLSRPLIWREKKANF